MRGAMKGDPTREATKDPTREGTTRDPPAEGTKETGRMSASVQQTTQTERKAVANRRAATISAKCRKKRKQL